MFDPPHYVYRSPAPTVTAYNLIANLPESFQNNPRMETTLQFFRVSMFMVVNYLLGVWPVLAISPDDLSYEHLAEDITEGHSIFYVGKPDESFGNQEFYAHFEIMIEILFELRDHLKALLSHAVDPNDEYDTTQLSCRSVMTDCVVIGVQPSYEKS